MSETALPNLSGVTESLLITLYIRAMESQRPDALIKDKKAEALLRQLSYDLGRIRLLHLSKVNKLVIVLRCRQFDCYVMDFLTSHPSAVVFHIGYGLHTRFERVDNGQVGGEHAENSIIVKVPEDGVMFTGDCYYLPPLHLRKPDSTPSFNILRRLQEDAHRLYVGRRDKPFTQAKLINFLQVTT